MDVNEKRQKITIVWNKDGKYYSVSAPNYNDDGLMEEARVTCIGVNNGWGVLFEDVGKSYIHIGSIAEYIKKAFERPSRTELEAGKLAFELAINHAYSLCKTRGYPHDLEIKSTHDLKVSTI